MESTVAKVVEQHWRKLVLKHTQGGACNFQTAALELATLVEAAERERCAKQLEELGCDHCAAALRAVRA